MWPILLAISPNTIQIEWKLHFDLCRNLIKRSLPNSAHNMEATRWSDGDTNFPLNLNCRKDHCCAWYHYGIILNCQYVESLGSSRLTTHVFFNHLVMQYDVIMVAVTVRITLSLCQNVYNYNESILKQIYVNSPLCIFRWFIFTLYILD